jgi:hypothetical protein
MKKIIKKLKNNICVQCGMKKYFQIIYYLGQRNYSIAWWYSENEAKRPTPYFEGGRTPKTWKTENRARKYFIKKHPEAIEIKK